VNLESFFRLCSARRATRAFRPDPIDEKILLELLKCAQTAPSGFNLQPTHFFVVQDHEKKSALLKACLNQQQIIDAPAVVVFTGDRRVVENNLEAMIGDEYLNGTMNEKMEKRLRRNVKLNFDNGFGFVWLGKLLGAPLLRLFTPMPTLPAVHKRFWLAKQVMMPAMNFMLAAEAAGLATSPIEGFDEWRVKRCLGIPMSHIVPIVIAVGFGAEEALKKSRLPLEEVAHFL
jgi:nitroreductase